MTMAIEIKGDSVTLSKECFEEQDFSYYGRLKGDVLELSLVEAAFLIERERLDLGITLKEFFKVASTIQPYGSYVRRLQHPA